MPLKSGYSHATFSANLAELLRAGHERDSAIMIAASKARQSFFKRFPAGALPNWLAFPKANGTAKYYDSGGRPLTGGIRSNPTADEYANRFAEATAVQRKKIEHLIGKHTIVSVGQKFVLAGVNDMGTLYWAKVNRGVIGKKLYTVAGTNIADVQSNPAEPDQRALSQATRLYQGFTGKAPRKVHKLNVPPLPKAALAIGKVFGIMYSVDATGERFHHEFKSKAQPLLVVSPDGHQVFLHGGAFTFTKRGFVDSK